MASFITAVKNMVFKIVNALIGKTAIFIIIFGWFLAITGIIFLAQPEKARKKILVHGFGIVKGIMFFAIIYVALLLISASGKISNGLIGTLLWLSAFILIFLYFVLKKKVFIFLSEKFTLIPINALKIYAFIQIVVGTLMIMLHKRIW
ncbi:MAG: hypothetical protein HQL27_03270 [Candidatus Omnitrophica bacterium]|nr:hypothetical protein [Candidatus Omnitrophota bacterium]